MGKCKIPKHMPESSLSFSCMDTFPICITDTLFLYVSKTNTVFLMCISNKPRQQPKHDSEQVVITEVTYKL